MGIVQRLRAAGCVYAEEEAALLSDAATDTAHLERLVAARTSGHPLEHVLGWAVDWREECGVLVRVDPGVFVPRRRTALLVRLAVEAAPSGGVVVDLCCGSGAVAVAVAAVRPDVEVHAADVDPGAVRCARRNLDPRRVHRGDLLDALPGALAARVDVVVANAPYVPTGRVALMPAEARDHEPRAALDGGPDGLALHRRIAATARPWLAPGGAVLVETSRQQAPATAGLLEAVGLQADVVHDPRLDGWAARGRTAGDR